MKDYTKKELEQLKKDGVDMWTLLANHPEWEKNDLPEYLRKKIDKLRSQCPLCEVYAFPSDNNAGNKTCYDCPLGKVSMCSQLNSYFTNWHHRRNQSENAQKIADVMKSWDYSDLLKQPNPSNKTEGITSFKSGYWYKWIGPKERPNHWNHSGFMDFLLDGKWHKCNEGDCDYASFFDCKDDQTRDWSFINTDMHNFKESKHKPIKKKYPVYPEDKAPITVWDSYTKCRATLVVGFYDDKNKSIFTIDGRRNGLKWRNIKPYKGKLPKHMRKAFKKLEEYMIIKKTWTVKKDFNKSMGVYRKAYLYTGYFLFGFIPIFIKRDTTRSL